MSEETTKVELTPEQQANQDAITKAQEDAVVEKKRQITLVNSLLAQLDGEKFGAALQISKGLYEAVGGMGQKGLNESDFAWSKDDSVEDKLGWVN